MDEEQIRVAEKIRTKRKILGKTRAHGEETDSNDSNDKSSEKSNESNESNDRTETPNPTVRRVNESKYNSNLPATADSLIGRLLATGNVTEINNYMRSAKYNCDYGDRYTLMDTAKKLLKDKGIKFDVNPDSRGFEILAISRETKKQLRNPAPISLPKPTHATDRKSAKNIIQDTIDDISKKGGSVPRREKLKHHLKFMMKTAEKDYKTEFDKFLKSSDLTSIRAVKAKLERITKPHYDKLMRNLPGEITKFINDNRNLINDNRLRELQRKLKYHIIENYFKDDKEFIGQHKAEIDKLFKELVENKYGIKFYVCGSGSDDKNWGNINVSHTKDAKIQELLKSKVSTNKETPNAETFFSYDIHHIFKIIKKDLGLVSLSERTKMDIEALMEKEVRDLRNKPSLTHGKSEINEVISDIESYINEINKNKTTIFKLSEGGKYHLKYLLKREIGYWSGSKRETISRLQNLKL